MTSAGNHPLLFECGIDKQQPPNPPFLPMRTSNVNGSLQQRDRPGGGAEGFGEGAVRAEEQDHRQPELPSGRTA